MPKPAPSARDELTIQTTTSLCSTSVYTVIYTLHYTVDGEVRHGVHAPLPPPPPALFCPMIGMHLVLTVVLLWVPCFVTGGTAYSGTAPVVFYSTVSSMGKVMYHTVGQYGTAVSVLNVDDYQGMDGPYVIGVHGPTRFFIYKYSTLMGKIDRFLSPALGTVLTTVRLPTAAFLATTKTASRLSPSAIYVTGTETKNGVETAYVQKLSEPLLFLVRSTR